MNASKKITPAILLVLCVVASVTAQKADTIVPKKGASYRGNVTKTSPQALMIKIKGKETKVPVNQINYIAFGDESPYMRQARDSIEEGQFEQAAARMARIEADKLKTDLVKSEFKYLQAKLVIEQALKGELPTADAATVAIEFLKSNKKSFHFYEVLESLGRLAMQMGNAEKAAAYFGQLAKAPFLETKMSASVLAGNALRSQGKAKFPEAIKRYDAVLNANASSSELKRQQGFALAGKAACQAALGKGAEVIEPLEKLIDEFDSKDIELHAAANNALGDCFRSMGQNEEAVYAYLHTDLLFFRDSSAHAEALYKLVQVFTDLGQPAFATQKRELLKTRYANSTWANR